MAQRLGSLIFQWDPEKMTIPETSKTVGIVNTYSGSAIFQWDAFLEGTEVTLKWDWMSLSQYNGLREKYLSSATFEWNPDSGGNSYNVKVVDLSGEYFETLNTDIEYRQNVSLRLNIRSQASTTTTTTTSSTTTTTTTTTTA